MVANLALQVQMLLLGVEREGTPPGATEADVVLGYACVGVLFSAMQTVQLLYQVQEGAVHGKRKGLICCRGKGPAWIVHAIAKRRSAMQHTAHGKAALCNPMALARPANPQPPQAVVKLFGAPGDLELVRSSFAQTEAWGTSAEALLMAQVRLGPCVGVKGGWGQRSGPAQRRRDMAPTELAHVRCCWRVRHGLPCCVPADRAWCCPILWRSRLRGLARRRSPSGGRTEQHGTGWHMVLWQSVVLSAEQLLHSALLICLDRNVLVAKHIGGRVPS